MTILLISPATSSNEPTAATGGTGAAAIAESEAFRAELAQTTHRPANGPPEAMTPATPARIGQDSSEHVPSPAFAAGTTTVPVFSHSGPGELAMEPDAIEPSGGTSGARAALPSTDWQGQLAGAARGLLRSNPMANPMASPMAGDLDSPELELDQDPQAIGLVASVAVSGVPTSQPASPSLPVVTAAAGDMTHPAAGSDAPAVRRVIAVPELPSQTSSTSAQPLESPLAVRAAPTQPTTGSPELSAPEVYDRLPSIPPLKRSQLLPHPELQGQAAAASHPAVMSSHHGQIQAPAGPALQDRASDSMTATPSSARDRSLPASPISQPELATLPLSPLEQSVRDLIDSQQADRTTRDASSSATVPSAITMTMAPSVGLPTPAVGAPAVRSAAPQPDPTDAALVTVARPQSASAPAIVSIPQQHGGLGFAATGPGPMPSRDVNPARAKPDPRPLPIELQAQSRSLTPELPIAPLSMLEQSVLELFAFADRGTSLDLFDQHELPFDDQGLASLESPPDAVRMQASATPASIAQTGRETAGAAPQVREPARPSEASNPSHVHLVLDDGPERVVMTVAVRGNEVSVAMRGFDDGSAASLARNAGSLDHAMRARGLELANFTAERGDRESHRPQQERRERPPDEQFTFEETT